MGKIQLTPQQLINVALGKISREEFEELLQSEREDKPKEKKPSKLKRLVNFAGKVISGGYKLAEDTVSYAWENRKGAAKLLGTLALSGAIATGCHKLKQPRTVFNGYIGDSVYRYYEDKGLLSQQNEMEIRKDGYVYTLIDSDNEENLDWKSNKPDSEMQVLEKVIVRDPTGLVTEIDRDNLQGENIMSDSARKTYAWANKAYNVGRLKVRKKLREQYARSSREAEESFAELSR